MALRENRRGVEALQAEDPGKAVDHFARGLAERPFLSPFHHNLGLSFDLQKRGDESLNSYRTAEKLAVDDDARFYARFNMGEQLGRAKRIDEALEWYQKALELRPDSRETKTNIELLLAGGQGQGEGQQNQDQKGDGQGKDQKQAENDKKDGEGQEPKDQNKQYQGNKKYEPRPFKGELSESDVKKILGEIKQQEQRIRAEYNRKDAKERPRDKDW